MGFFDKAKAFMTGSHAKVQIEHPALVYPSMPIAVKVIVNATMDFDYNGIFVDVWAGEHVKVQNPQGGADLTHEEQTYNQELKIANAGKMTKDQTQEFTGTITLPPTLQPSYTGKFATHEIRLRGRVDTKGNDPDTGFQVIRVGAMV